ncbi:MAG: hypothetical protein IJT59_00250 [Desulfovibrionaceae bacterium]|nr:hypothetical protein [Desulfovibrionaceae bacterium]
MGIADTAFYKTCCFISFIFDRIAHFWEKSTTQHSIALYLFLVYLVSLLGIVLNNLNCYPPWLPTPPTSHFAAIHLAFSLILIMELMSLIFVIPASLSTSIGKQFEILTLILLRNAFKELTTLQEPVHISLENIDSLITIVVSAGGALAVFVCLGFFRKIVQHPHFIKDINVRKRYIMAKKMIATVLFLIFIYVGIQDLVNEIQLDKGSNFFETIYTILIFADIGVVLIAQRYMTGYFAIFRNSGFVIGTLLMRLSLSAPPLWSPCISLVSALFVLGLTWGTNKYIPHEIKTQESSADQTENIPETNKNLEQDQEDQSKK